MRKIYFLPFLFLIILGVNGTTNAQMALDNSFNTDGRITLDPGGFGGFVRKVLLQQDGKILLCGYTSSAGNNRFVVSRLDSLGQPDVTFGNGGFALIDINGLDARCYSADLQDDGKIVLAGYVISGPPTERDIAVVRLDVDGSLDGSFGTGGIVVTPATTDDDVIFACEVLSTGQILVAGKTGNGANSNVLFAQYNSDGTSDFGFGSLGVVMFDLGNNLEEGVNTISVTSNGRIFAGGFQQVNTLSKGFVIQILSDGTLETSFAGTGVFTADVSASNDEVKAMATDGNGMIYAAGHGGNSSFMFVYKIFPDGSIDSSYAINGLITNTGILGANALELDTIGRIWLAGSNGVDYGLLKYRQTGEQDTTFAGTGPLTTDFSGNTDIAYSVVVQPNGKLIAAGSSIVGSSNLFSASRYANSLVSANGGSISEADRPVVYPNPVSEKIRIQSGNPYSNFQLMDIDGRKVLDGNLSKGEITVQGMPSGMYFLQVERQQGYWDSYKILIQH